MAFLLARSAAAAPCAPARLAAGASALPQAWRAALDRLAAATQDPGRPWSCHDAEITLRLDEAAGTAQLIVTMPDWPKLERAVESPADVLPVGEAMLSRPLELTPPPAERVPPPAPPIDPAPPPPPRAPRLLIGAVVDVRYSAHVSGVWLGGGMRVTVPLDAWSLGMWARYEQGLAELTPTPVEFSMASGSLGVSIGRRLLDGPVELNVALEPSLAIIAMDGGRDDDGGDVEQARGDIRVGARLQAAWPLGARWRGLVALDGEISPGAVASVAHRTLAPQLPPIPSFTLGLSLGGELIVR